MTFCATLFEGVAVWAGLPATLFALMLLLGFRLNTRFTWILLLLGVAGLATEGLSIACAGWSTGIAIVPTRSGLFPLAQPVPLQRIGWINAAWLASAVLIILACGLAIWRLARPRRGNTQKL